MTGLAEQRSLAEAGLALIEQRLIETAHDPFQFEKAKAEHTALRAELERVVWAERAAVKAAEAAEAARIQTHITTAVDAGREALATAEAMIQDHLWPAIERLVEVTHELADLQRILVRGFDVEIWGSTKGLVPKATLVSRLPITSDQAARVIKIGFELARIGGASPAHARQRAEQMKDL